MSELIFQADERARAAIIGVRAVFDDLADKRDIERFNCYARLLKLSLTDDVPRWSAPTSLWRCNVIEPEVGCPIIQYSQVLAMQANGDAGFVLLEISQGNQGGLTVNEELMEIEADASLVIASGRGDQRYRKVAGQIASMARTLAALKVGS